MGDLLRFVQLTKSDKHLTGVFLFLDFFKKTFSLVFRGII